MVAFSTLVSVGLFVVASNAAPTRHHKRIAQDIDKSTVKWVKACTAAGGGEKCNPISVAAFTTLLAAGGNCDQQDAADKMVDLAKTLGNDPNMIKFAQLFLEQPRNAPDSLQVPYCQVPPKNNELNGYYHCQFAGTVKDGDASKFSGDQTGNLPLGVTAVNPPGSCPASKTPVDDGAQLTDSTEDPGTPQGGGGGGGAGAADADASDADGEDADACDTDGDGGDPNAGASDADASDTDAADAADPSGPGAKDDANAGASDAGAAGAADGSDAGATNDADAGASDAGAADGSDAGATNDADAGASDADASDAGAAGAGATSDADADADAGDADAAAATNAADASATSGGY